MKCFDSLSRLPFEKKHEINSLKSKKKNDLKISSKKKKNIEIPMTFYYCYELHNAFK